VRPAPGQIWRHPRSRELFRVLTVRAKFDAWPDVDELEIENINIGRSFVIGGEVFADQFEPEEASK